jgi:hypothetical protein
MTGVEHRHPRRAPVQLGAVVGVVVGVVGIQTQ